MNVASTPGNSPANAVAPESRCLARTLRTQRFDFPQFFPCFIYADRYSSKSPSDQGFIGRKRYEDREIEEVFHPFRGSCRIHLRKSAESSAVNIEVFHASLYGRVRA